jgi:hypothetical protein
MRGGDQDREKCFVNGTFYVEPFFLILLEKYLLFKEIFFIPFCHCVFIVTVILYLLTM